MHLQIFLEGISLANLDFHQELPEQDYLLNNLLLPIEQEYHLQWLTLHLLLPEMISMIVEKKFL